MRSKYVQKMVEAIPETTIKYIEVYANYSVYRRATEDLIRSIEKISKPFTPEVKDLIDRALNEFQEATKNTSKP